MSGEHESFPEPTNVLRWAAEQFALLALEPDWTDDPDLCEAAWDLDDAFGPVADEDGDDE